MSLQAHIEEKREAILQRWIKRILDTYPEDSAAFLRKQTDRFANPVGHAIRIGMGEMLDAVVQGADPESVAQRLDDLVRIRAVQHMSPARALGFIFELKEALAEELREELTDSAKAAELRLVAQRVDTLGLLGFDIYTRCREQVYEIRLAELRGQRVDVKERMLAKQGKWEKLAELQEKKRQAGQPVTLQVLHSDAGAPAAPARESNGEAAAAVDPAATPAEPPSPEGGAPPNERDE